MERVGRRTLALSAPSTNQISPIIGAKHMQRNDYSRWLNSVAATNIPKTEKPKENPEFTKAEKKTFSEQATAWMTPNEERITAYKIDDNVQVISTHEYGKVVGFEKNWIVVQVSPSNKTILSSADNLVRDEKQRSLQLFIDEMRSTEAAQAKSEAYYNDNLRWFNRSVAYNKDDYVRIIQTGQICKYKGPSKTCPGFVEVHDIKSGAIITVSESQITKSESESLNDWYSKTEYGKALNDE
jgi:hypothetical protein